VGVIGNRRVQTYTPWELVMPNLPEGAPNIATLKVKWDPAYQEKIGLVTQAADLSPEMTKRIERLSKRIYNLLFLSGYARLDYRLTEEGDLYFLEANPNRNLAYGDDFAESADHCGIPYDTLLQKIISLGLSYNSAG
jgi:D-alanine-D-alanine ligase